MLPPALSAINFVEYLKPDDKASSIALARSLSAISDFKPLPDPLPEPPEVPISYIGDLARKIEDSSELSKEEQSDLLMDIESLLDEPGTATGDALSLLRTLQPARK